MRSRYGDYPEYHTSLDDFTVVTPRGLQGGFEALRKAIEIIEQNRYPQTTVLGEPQLGKLGLYPETSTKTSGFSVRTMMNLLAYSDGQRDLIEIAETIGVPVWELIPIYQVLSEHGLLVDSVR